jgi:hypothetical protein
MTRRTCPACPACCSAEELVSDFLSKAGDHLRDGDAVTIALLLVDAAPSFEVQWGVRLIEIPASVSLTSPASVGGGASADSSNFSSCRIRIMMLKTQRHVVPEDICVDVPASVPCHTLSDGVPGTVDVVRGGEEATTMRVSESYSQVEPRVLTHILNDDIQATSISVTAAPATTTAAASAGLGFGRLRADSILSFLSPASASTSTSSLVGAAEASMEVSSSSRALKTVEESVTPDQPAGISIASSSHDDDSVPEPVDSRNVPEDGVGIDSSKAASRSSSTLAMQFPYTDSVYGQFQRDPHLKFLAKACDRIAAGRQSSSSASDPSVTGAANEGDIDATASTDGDGAGTIYMVPLAGTSPGCEGDGARGQESSTWLVCTVSPSSSINRSACGGGSRATGGMTSAGGLASTDVEDSIRMLADDLRYLAASFTMGDWLGVSVSGGGPNKKPTTPTT